MAVSRAMRRLLRIRDLEEEQSRLALESALAEVRSLEAALGAAQERDRRGRRLVAASAQSGELPDRVAGLEETITAQRHSSALTPRIAEAEIEAGTLRQEFLSKRVERRQAETLIREAEAAEALDEGRRGQQAIDDWYRTRLYRGQMAEAQSGESASAGTATGAGKAEDKGMQNKT